MPPEFNNYITRNYYELLKVCKKYTKNDDWASELLHEVLFQLYERGTIKLEKLEDNQIKGYIVRCITVNWCYTSSPFYKKIKRHSMLDMDLNDVGDPPVEDNELREHLVMETIEEEFCHLNWFSKDILSRYLLLGSYRKVSLQTTISQTSIKRYVKDAKNEIKINVFKKIK